jgi:hypothetical protein
MPSAASSKAKHTDNGTVCLSRREFHDYFDQQARRTVRLSGKKALRRIRAGRAGSSLAWSELSLLSTLLRD